MVDDKIARVKALIQKREEIDAELAALFGGEASRRGRPRKDPAGRAGNGDATASSSQAAVPSTAQDG
jgi:hypothetical protein